MTADPLADTPPSATQGYTYPEGWRLVRLGDVGSIVGGSTPSTKVDEYWNGRIPWLTPNEVTRAPNLMIAETDRRITEQGLANCSATLLPIGTVMMTSRATIGEVAINTVPMATNQGFINIVCENTTISNEFLAYWLVLHKKVLVSRASGSTFLEISKSSFKSIPIPLPPIAEQRAIARVLRAAQDASAARRCEVTLERERKAALMQRLFTQGTRGEPTKQTAIGEMPESWQVVRLGDTLVKTQYGLSLRGESVGSYPILRMNCLVDGHVDTADLQYVTTDDTTLRQFRLAQGDILFNRTNSYELVGKTALFDLPGNFLFASYLIRVIPLPEILLSGFLNAYFNTSRTQQRLRMLASRGVSQSNISASKLQEFFIPLPSLDEQRAIADTLAACDAHIAALEREVALHEDLFRALLEELMSGRLSALPLAEAAGEMASAAAVMATVPTSAPQSEEGAIP